MAPVTVAQLTVADELVIADVVTEVGVPHDAAAEVVKLTVLLTVPVVDPQTALTLTLYTEAAVKPVKPKEVVVLVLLVQVVAEDNLYSTL